MEFKKCSIARHVYSVEDTPEASLLVQVSFSQFAAVYSIPFHSIPCSIFHLFRFAEYPEQTSNSANNRGVFDAIGSVSHSDSRTR